VLSADVLCHGAVDPATALAELRRVLAPGRAAGAEHAVVPVADERHDRQVHNTRRTTAGALSRDLAGAGFAEVRARYWNGLLLPLMIVQRKVLARAQGDGETVSDVAAFPPFIDATFHALTALERRLGLPLPCRRLGPGHRPQAGGNA
jgi:hypothetical protein